MSSDSEEEKVVKKRPGRPRKVVDRPSIPREGLVKLPQQYELLKDTGEVNIVELLYDKPAMFKKIFNLFHSMGAESIRLKFDLDGIKLYSTDHVGKSHIYVEILGKRMNRYYCDHAYEVGISSSNFKKIMQTLNKDNSKIQLCVQKMYENSKVQLALYNDIVDESSVYDNDIDHVDPFDWTILAKKLSDEANYPVKFELPFTYFKRKVGYCKVLSEIIRIEKNGDEDLKLSYTYTDKRGEHSTNFKSPAKINLRSKVKPMEIFSTSVYIEHIKALSASLIAETIHISADKEKDLIFTALLDEDEDGKNRKFGTEKCIIKVMTEVVKH